MNKKKMLVSSIVAICSMIVITTSGCGVAKQIAQDAKDQMEWAEENGTLTDGAKPNSEMKKSVEEIADAILDTEETTETSSMNNIKSSSGDVHHIADTIPMSFSNDYISSDFEITITGCDPVYNYDENCTAVTYTVTCTGGDTLSFDNTMLSMYADNVYVEAGCWENYSPYSSATLRNGMSYEGCYVGKVDMNQVNTISVFLGDEEWDIPINSVNADPEDINPTSVIDSDYLDWAGVYTDGSSTVTINMYSSPEEDVCGNMSASIDGYGEVSCDIQYYDETPILILGVDINTPVSIYCSEENGVKSITMSIVYGDNFETVYAGPLEMTEHFES